MSQPVQSFLAPEIPSASFVDCFYRDMALPDNITAMEVYQHLMLRTPSWVEALMAWRNAIAARIGLKHLGNMSELATDKDIADYQPGEKIGIFTVRHISPHEVVVEDKDKHLNVSISLYLETLADGRVRVYVTTVVHVNNWLGHLYMGVVAPMHKLIVPATLRQIPSRMQSTA